MKKVQFDIQGMTCSSCSAHVERAVNRLKSMKKRLIILIIFLIPLMYIAMHHILDSKFYQHKK